MARVLFYFKILLENPYLEPHVSSIKCQVVIVFLSNLELGRGCDDEEGELASSLLSMASGDGQGLDLFKAQICMISFSDMHTVIRYS